MAKNKQGSGNYSAVSEQKAQNCRNSMDKADNKATNKTTDKTSNKAQNKATDAYGGSDR